MSTHTERTRAWLDRKVAESTARRWQRGYQRLYHADDRLGAMPVGHVVELARTLAVLRVLARCDIESCLDVGCGAGWMTHLVGQLYGVRCAGVDLSREFAASARRDFGLPAYVSNAAALPFTDEQFDLVLCAEVLEHVEHPLAALAELWRVARCAVLVTTQEGCRGAWQRRLHMLAADRSDPHAERNYFVPDDFRRAFGGTAEVFGLLELPERIRLFPRRSLADLRACLSVLTATEALGPGSFGVLVIARKRQCDRPAHMSADAILEVLLDRDRARDDLAARRGFDPYVDAVPPGTVPVLAQPRPVCPDCHGVLESAGGDAVRCARCAKAFPVEEEVPILLGSEATAARSERACASAAALAPVGRALAQPPLPSRALRRGLRAAMKLVDFLRLPLPWRQKAKIGWRFLRE